MATRPPASWGIDVNRYERAQALAKTAIGLMAERSVAPTPENFELFYAYAAGDNPAVSRIMGDMIAGRRAFTPTVLDDLRKRFFAKARVEEAIENPRPGRLRHLGIGARTNWRKPGAAPSITAAPCPRPAASSAPSIRPPKCASSSTALRDATQTMAERTKSLETELQNSSREVNELKRKLDDVRKESLTDPLTGIANRKAFDTEIARAVQKATRKRRTGCLC